MFEKIDKKKALIDSKRPFPPNIIKNIKSYYDIELTYNSNAIEGNTLTLAETRIVIEDGLTVGRGKSLREHLEAINHKEAIDFVEDVVKNRIEINESIIKQLHFIILKSIDDKNAGKYRDINVFISGSRHKPPINILVPEKMRELISWYKQNKDILHPVQLASLFHFKLTYIHPFVDGNGRVARLMMNLILMNNGYPPAIIRIEDRLEYMECLERASVDGKVDDFIHFIAKTVETSLDFYLRMLQ